MTSPPEYDVALSFAGEDRDYVRDVADKLRSSGVRTFFDEFKTVELWGKDLFAHLHYVYSQAARHCVMFISKDYAKKVWPNHERASAQEKALIEHGEYVLPARFDDTPVPGLRATISYIDLREKSPSDLAELIIKKLGNRRLEEFFPPKPDRLISALGIGDEDDAKTEVVIDQAYHFFETFKRMSEEERIVIMNAFLFGCAEELPENIHIELDLLRRITNLPPRQILDSVAAIQSLGYQYTIRENHSGEHGAPDGAPMLVLTWFDLHRVPEEKKPFIDYSTTVAQEVIFTATTGLCEEHALEALLRLDFGQLSSPTARTDADMHAAVVELELPEVPGDLSNG